MPRRYFRTKGTDAVRGLIRNFELDSIPANPKVRLDFGIVGDDDERLFDALRWLWDRGLLDRTKLVELKGDGAALTEAVNLPDNPFAPVSYQTIWDLVRRWEAKHRASEGDP